MFELETLPSPVPIFPLTGALLLPKGHLPLNIFEQRYLDMVRYARYKSGIIGMVQPLAPHGEAQGGDDRRGTAPRGRALYKTGCLGMISDMTEKEDGTIFVMLTGLCRFDIQAEEPKTRTFREVRPNYSAYQQDCMAPRHIADIDREALLKRVEEYLKNLGIHTKWEGLDQADDEGLINSLAMICPFDAAEKQALLEANTLQDRVLLMSRIMDFACLNNTEDDDEPYIH